MWYKTFSNKLIEFGFSQSKHDHCLFIMSNEHHFIALLVYVDYIFVIGSNQSKIVVLKAYMDKEFTIKDLGLVDLFLGVEIDHSNSGLFLSPYKYARDIIQNENILGAKPAPTPLPVGCKFT